MMTMKKRLADWWFAPAPAERLAALRIILGTYAIGVVLYEVHATFELERLEARFFPVGLARLVAHPLPHAAILAIAIATVALLAAFVLGIGYRVTAPLAALGLAWTLCYRNSWGMVFHTENLLVLHIIALACAPAADAWALARRRESAGGYGWPIKLLVALTAATYVVAAIAKLRIAGLGWLDGDLLRNQIAFDNLRKAVYGAQIAPLATLFLGHASGFTAFSVGTLVLELGAPIALLGGRAAHAWALASWGFHVGVVLLMFIVFPYPLFGLAYLPLFAIERPIQWVLRRRSG